MNTRREYLEHLAASRDEWQLVPDTRLLRELEVCDLVQVTEQPDGRVIARITGRGQQQLKKRRGEVHVDGFYAQYDGHINPLERLRIKEAIEHSDGTLPDIAHRLNRWDIARLWRDIRDIKLDHLLNQVRGAG